MKDVRFTKKLQEEKLYQDYLDLKKDCILLNLDKEENHNNYKNYLSNTFNQKISSYNKSIITKSQANLQKASHIIEVATKRGLVPNFMTITLPSNFHFMLGSEQNSKYIFHSINEKFDFVKLEYAIQEGYKLLRGFFRAFYKSIKKLSSNIMYIACIEPHKSMIPHMHILGFFEKDLLNQIQEKFNKFVKKYKVGKTDYIVLDEKEKGKLAGKYIFKYMFKNLSKNNQTYSRMLDGYYKKHKIRAYTMSTGAINLDVYKKIYHNLDQDYKNNLVKSLNRKQSIFGYVANNISIVKEYVDTKENTIEIKEFNTDTSKEFRVYMVIRKYQDIFTNKSMTKVLSFKVIHYVNDEFKTLYEKNNCCVNNTNFFLLEDAS